ncbi:AAA domain protein [Reticulomyxa filosa]|uniref:AAA domain protein n=1 Tax=Reticulomyxa filosa TaxID=46433 RepID=X6MJI2_RETFI|nr:AAA domain protein [Reticulomyxa filosa]|eukprot:ETO14173.1 AAA domain protein [Reticulomyxa filosa]
MRHLFRMARERAPAIIFIDEIDSLLTARGGSNEGEASRRVKTEFLVQFDGVLSSKEADASITVIGATNLPHQLDEAVLRRFPKRIMVPNPDRAARYALLRLMARKHDHALAEENFQTLADATENYSGSDLTMLCSDALMGPLREAMLRVDLTKASKAQIPKLSYRHFQQSLNNIRASVPPQKERKLFDQEQNEKVEETDETYDFQEDEPTNVDDSEPDTENQVITFLLPPKNETHCPHPRLGPPKNLECIKFVVNLFETFFFWCICVLFFLSRRELYDYFCVSPPLSFFCVHKNVFSLLSDFLLFV